MNFCIGRPKVMKMLIVKPTFTDVDVPLALKMNWEVRELLFTLETLNI
jgi:hypothetical protein